MNTKTKIIVGALIIAIVAFFAGDVYGKRAPNSSQAAGGSFRGMNVAKSGRGSFVSGNVISKDDKSITIGVNGGGSKIVFYSSSTAVMKSAAGSIGDVQANEQVTIIGNSNSDGSVTAQSIQIRPTIPATPAAK